MKRQQVQAVIGLFGLGLFLSAYLYDPKFPTDRFHHWQLGLALLGIGVIP